MLSQMRNKTKNLFMDWYSKENADLHPKLAIKTPMYAVPYVLGILQQPSPWHPSLAEGMGSWGWSCPLCCSGSHPCPVFCSHPALGSGMHYK